MPAADGCRVEQSRLQKVVHTGKRPPPSDVYSAEIVNNLMRGIYRSIEEVDESAIYDSLAKVTSEEVRQRVYLEMIQSLRMSEQGGAVAHVGDIRIDTVSSPVAISNEAPNLDMKLSDAAWSTQVTWTVAGTVEHWGHIHERVNQFTADVTIDATSTERQLADHAARSNVRRSSQFQDATALTSCSSPTCGGGGLASVASQGGGLRSLHQRSGRRLNDIRPSGEGRRRRI